MVANQEYAICKDTYQSPNRSTESFRPITIYLFIYLFTPYLSYHRYLQGLANMKLFMSHSAKDDDSYFGIGFRLPYNELLLWAVLCNFHKMALFMWERGDENLAKALVAGKLFRSLAKEMAKDELKGDVSEELEAHSR